jgi:Glycosyl transferase family 2
VTAVRPTIPSVEAQPDRPRWSVMIPTYNCAAYLAQTLRSVLEQDQGLNQMQIAVVDDASDDDPRAVVEALGAERVEFFAGSENRGAVANLNRCIELARGELVHLLHGDDWVLPGFYATMQAPFDDPAVGAAFCRYIAADSEGVQRKVASLEQPTAGIIPGWLERIAEGQRLQTPTMVVRRAVYEALGGFDPRLAYAEDWEMWVRIAAQYAVWYEPEALAVYRIAEGSLSGRMLQTGENVDKLLLAIETNAESLPPDRAEAISKVARRSTARAALRRGRRLQGLGNPKAMWAQLRAAWRSDPSPEILIRSGYLVAIRTGRVALELTRRATGR